MSTTKLTRSESDKFLTGVCGGLAQYIGVDSTFVRVGFVILFLASGFGLPVYLILALVMPSEESANRPTTEVVKENIDDLADSFAAGVEKIQSGESAGGSNKSAVILIGLGIALLLSQLGIISGGIIWPLALVGLGIYLIVDHRRS